MVALVFCKGCSKEDHDIKIKYKQRKKTLKKGSLQFIITTFKMLDFKWMKGRNMLLFYVLTANSALKAYTTGQI